MKLPIFAVLLFQASTAQAARLDCQALFDESSHYELSAELGDRQGSATFRFITEDGLDLRSEMEVERKEIKEGAYARISAKNESMSIELDVATTESSSPKLSGLLKVFFSLDSVEPLELDASCSLK